MVTPDYSISLKPKVTFHVLRNMVLYQMQFVEWKLKQFVYIRLNKNGGTVKLRILEG